MSLFSPEKFVTLTWFKRTFPNITLSFLRVERGINFRPDPSSTKTRFITLSQYSMVNFRALFNILLSKSSSLSEKLMWCPE